MAKSIAQVNECIKEIIAKNCSTIDIEGEISSCKTYGKAIYLTLKDLGNTTSILNCCIWDSTYFDKNILQVGKSICATGKITGYVKGGTYQFIINSVTLINIKGCHDALTLLKEYYNNLGYFSNERKKKLPKYINSICIISAISGAAIKDMLCVFEQNNFLGKICVKNASVQGIDCANSIVKALQETDKLHFDIIIITRGGGSFEDLNGFNDRKIVEQIYKMNTYVMTAIGHEIDTVLIDYIADCRASTPTRCAEIICNLNPYTIDKLLQIKENIKINILNKILEKENKLQMLKLKLPNKYIIISILNKKQNIIKNNMLRKLNYYKESLIKFKSILENYKPKNTIMIMNYNTNKLICTTKAYKKAIKNLEPLVILFNDGYIKL